MTDERCSMFYGGDITGPCERCGWTVSHHFRVNEHGVGVMIDGDVTEAEGFKDMESALMAYYGIVGVNDDR